MYNIMFFGAFLTFHAIFLSFTVRGATPAQISERELQQQCPFLPINVAGSIRNIIVSTRLSNQNINRVDVEVIYDIDIDAGALASFNFIVFDELFGNVRGGFDTDVIFDDNETAFEALIPERAQTQVRIPVCFSPRAEDSSTTITFEVNNNVCLHSSGRQALAAGWLSDATTSTVEFVGVEWSVPLQPGTPMLGINDLAFEPRTENFFIDQESEENRLNLFLSYDQSELNIQDPNAEANIFFFLPIEFFNSNELPACEEFENDFNFFTVVLATIPAIACVCLVGLAIGQRYYDRREAERFRRIRQERQNNNLRLYPGNQDIVLVPGAGGAENENNIVQAVLEDDDAQELDEVIPTTTINVRLQSRESQDE